MLKQGNCVKTMAAATSDTLEANAGESFLIKGIIAYPGESDTYLTLKVDRKTVGFYRFRGRGGNQLASPHIYGDFGNIIQFLTDAGINMTIPVAEGQILTFSRGGVGGNIALIYDCFDAGDIRADMPNGTDSKEYTFVQYMTHDGTIDADEDLLMDTSLTPSEFPDFPVGAIVPARCTIDIVALVGSPLRNKSAGGAEYCYTTFIKLIKDRETLFDEDSYGLPFLGDLGGSDGRYYTSKHSLIAPSGVHGSDDVGWGMGRPLIFDPALHFISGEELLFYVSVVANHDSQFDDFLDIGAVLRVKKE